MAGKEDEKKFRKCRQCGKDNEVGAPCDCGWNEEEQQGRVRGDRLRREIEREQEEAEKKSRRGSKGGLFG